MSEIFDWYLKVIRNYAYFGGRARRSEYWYFTLVSIGISVAIQLTGGILGAILHPIGLGGISFLFGGIAALYGLAVLVPSVAVGVRRLHDTGRSGWWLLISLVPVIGILVMIYFFILNSQPGTNRWGPNPKELVGVAQPGYAFDKTL